MTVKPERPGVPGSVLRMVADELEIVAYNGPGSFQLQEECRARRKALSPAQGEVYLTLLPGWRQDWISLLDTVEQLA